MINVYEFLFCRNELTINNMQIEAKSQAQNQSQIYQHIIQQL